MHGRASCPHFLRAGWVGSGEKRAWHLSDRWSVSSPSSTGTFRPLIRGTFCLPVCGSTVLPWVSCPSFVFMAFLLVAIGGARNRTVNSELSNYFKDQNERKRPPEWRPSLCLHLFLYLDTSKTSTGVGKEDDEKGFLVNLLARHISRVYEPSFAVKSIPVDNI